MATEPQVTRRYSTGESDLPPAAHEFTPGELPNVKPVKGLIGPYSLVCELGSGGMGTVFVAKRTLPGDVTATVALKTLKSRSLPRPNLVEMFLDEVKLIARISHPYVCSVRDLGVVDGVPYVAMDYLVGEPLSRVIPVLASPPDLTSIACSVRLIADLSEGLHAAHELRDEAGTAIEVVHRDISPDNLFVLYDGTVRVVDFGIACTAELQKQGKTKVLAGKCAYMSPEQLRTKELDRRSDIWSMGVVLWELLTGRRLFHRQSDLRTAVAVLEGPLEPPSRHNPLVPSALDDVVMHALSREPDKRPATARELSRELDSVLANSFGPVTASRLGNWLNRLFPGSFEFRRRIVSHAEQAQKSAELVSPESLRTRELDVDLMASIEAERAGGGPVDNDVEDTTNPPVTLLRLETTERLPPVEALPAEPPGPAAKSLISEWLDEQSSPIFTKEPLQGFDRSKRTAGIPGLVASNIAANVAAQSSEATNTPAPEASGPRALPEGHAFLSSKKLVVGSALFALLSAALVWFAWPGHLYETATPATTPLVGVTRAAAPANRPLDPTEVMQAPSANLPEPSVEPNAEPAGAPTNALIAEPSIAAPSVAEPSVAEPSVAEPSSPPQEVAGVVPEPAVATAPHKEAQPPAEHAPTAAAPRTPRVRTAPLEGAANTGKVYVMSKVPELTVSYNGKPMRLPAMLTLPAGAQVLLLQRAGVPQPGRMVDVKPGSVGLITLE